VAIRAWLGRRPIGIRYSQLWTWLVSNLDRRQAGVANDARGASLLARRTAAEVARVRVAQGTHLVPWHRVDLNSTHPGPAESLPVERTGFIKKLPRIRQDG
jgi:hypothetical protein